MEDKCIIDLGFHAQKCIHPPLTRNVHSRKQFQVILHAGAFVLNDLFPHPDLNRVRLFFGIMSWIDLVMLIMRSSTQALY